MSVTVLLTVTAKAECRDDLIAMFAQNFRQTRVYDGCIDVYMALSDASPNELLLVQQWQTRPFLRAARRLIPVCGSPPASFC